MAFSQRVQDGAQRRRKQVSEWDKLMGNVEESETDEDVPGIQSVEFISANEEPEDVELYTVVYSKVAARLKPSMGAEPIGILRKGEQVKTYGWDETALWRKIHFRIGGQGKVVGAWVLVSHEQFGLLLRSENAAQREREADELAQREHELAQRERELKAAADSTTGKRGIALTNAGLEGSNVFVLNIAELGVAAQQLALTRWQVAGKKDQDLWTDFLVQVGKVKAPYASEEEEEENEDSNENNKFFDFMDPEEARERVTQGSVLYEVVMKPRLPVYSKPSSKNGRELGYVDHGLRLDTFTWGGDEKTWRSVCCELSPSGKLLTGWVCTSVVVGEMGITMLEPVAA